MVSFKDSKPDRCDDEVAAAKEKISTILANLDVDSKEEVITWLNNLCVDKGIFNTPMFSLGDDKAFFKSNFMRYIYMEKDELESSYLFVDKGGLSVDCLRS